MKFIYKLIEDLQSSGLSYSIGGSGLLNSLGFSVQMGDWDVFVDGEKNKVMDALKNWEIEERTVDSHPLFKSEFLLGVKDAESKPIEIIGYFKIKTEEGLIPLPSVVHHRWENLNIGHPVIWFVAYSLMGRIEKASILRQYLVNHPPNDEWIEFYLRMPIPEELKRILLDLSN
ncbi:hypothetical protein SAMN05877753_104126 [Bacillus oleivorans]|uniref:Uncharacterized protein n=1 Tax=Bacillus oleivorans TaxID=1448271 RepID=A0A285CU24_9BACI|nr:hypothetical protein [Bacillus oleivorans]SNX70453.1 hypothetical protein SAMN05877753_104126 [Bacillus oleivorans]